jgi:hypothetical protein
MEPFMRTSSTLIAIAALAFALAPRPAAAQGAIASQAQIEIDRTDRRIERAQDVVAGSDLETARNELSTAIQLQASAKFDLTYRARARADRAIALVNGLPDPDRVLAQLERTQELIERARENIEDCNNDRARAMVQTAADMQKRAEEAARGGRYLGALQLTMSARERVHRALRLCNLEENLQDSAERALHRTDDAISRAREEVDAANAEQAKRLLDRAVDQQARATAEFRAERYEASLRMTLAARGLAYRAVRNANRRG